MVGVALPSIDADLSLSTTSLQWIVSGYVLGYGGFLLLGGRAADLLGRRRVFLGALVLFAVASLLGGLVSDGTLLIATRFVKGIAAAFTAPAALSIITTTFGEGSARNRALGIYAATGATGFSSGLVFGGVLTELGWRYTFLVPVVLTAGLLALAVRYVPEGAPPDRAGRTFDLPGAALITGSMLLTVFTIVQAPDAGWTSLQTLASLAGAITLIALFVAVELRSAQPLVRLGILRSPTLRRANLTAMTVFGAWIGFQFAGTLYMQQLRGWSAFEMAAAFLPAGLLVAFGSPLRGRARRPRRHRPRHRERHGGVRRRVHARAGHRRGVLVRHGDPPHDAARRRRLHPDVRAAEHGRDAGRRRRRAGPGVRPAVHVAAARRRGGAGGRDRRDGSGHRGVVGTGRLRRGAARRLRPARSSCRSSSRSPAC